MFNLNCVYLRVLLTMRFTMLRRTTNSWVPERANKARLKPETAAIELTREWTDAQVNIRQTILGEER